MNTMNLETHAQPAPESAPVTEPASRSLRAYRHGLTGGQIVLLTGADQIAYAEHCRGFFKSFAPVGPVEHNLCQGLCDDRWRLQRGASLESAIFAAEILGPDELKSGDAEIDATLALGRAWITRGGNLALLTLYESRIQRRFEKNLAILKSIQAERIAALEKACEDADLLAQLAESKDEDIGPVIAPLFRGFDFSDADHLRLLKRHRDLREAKRRFGHPKKPLKRAA
jgi:hypothetical protein